MAKKSRGTRGRDQRRDLSSEKPDSPGAADLGGEVLRGAIVTLDAGVRAPEFEVTQMTFALLNGLSPEERFELGSRAYISVRRRLEKEVDFRFEVRRMISQEVQRLLAAYLFFAGKQAAADRKRSRRLRSNEVVEDIAVEPLQEGIRTDEAQQLWTKIVKNLAPNARLALLILQLRKPLTWVSNEFQVNHSTLKKKYMAGIKLLARALKRLSRERAGAAATEDLLDAIAACRPLALADATDLPLVIGQRAPNSSAARRKSSPRKGREGGFQNRPGRQTSGTPKRGSRDAKGSKGRRSK